MIPFSVRSVAIVLGCSLAAAATPAVAGHRGGGHGGGGHHAGAARGGGFAAPRHFSAVRPASFYAGGRYIGYTGNRLGARGYRLGHGGYRPGYLGYGSRYLGFGLGYLGYGSGYAFGNPGYGLGYGGFGFGYPRYNTLGPYYGLGLGPYGTAFNPYVPPTPWYDGPFAPAKYGPDPPADVRARPAAPGKVEVLLPDANAEVLFDGQKIAVKGTRRVYPTPNLAPGRRYWYRVRANWVQDGQPVHEERMVYVSAGDTTVVSFRK